MPMPPARTGPASSVTTGLGRRQHLALERDDRAGALLHAAGAGLGEVGAGAEHPARRADQHDLDGLVLARGRSTWPTSSVTSCRESALRLCGESSVMVASGPSTLEVDQLRSGVSVMARILPTTVAAHGALRRAWRTTWSWRTGCASSCSATPTTEKQMFGGLAFLVNGNMAIAVEQQGRVDGALRARGAPTATSPARRRRRMEMRGKELDGWLRVDGRGGRRGRRPGRLGRGGRRQAAALPPK